MFSRPGLLALQAAPSIGGQAVMEGVMMRNKDRLAIAVRRADGSIHTETWAWYSLARASWMRKPFIRGFPVLVETLVNGIKALNFSASQALIAEDGQAPAQELKPWHLMLTLAAAIAMALGLFVVAPHLFSLAMKALGIGGDVDGLSFHAWDGFFKLAIFLGYLVAISFIPDIRRVFQYHGAEHKVVWAYEKDKPLELAYTRAESRLHPRCGTAFLLFVLSISIVLHAVLVPFILFFWTPDNVVLKHVFIVFVKLLLVIPISALAYEAIRFAGRHSERPLCRLFSGPGLLLQLMTTQEPDDSQLEVATVALQAALAQPEHHAREDELETHDVIVGPPFPGVDSPIESV